MIVACPHCHTNYTVDDALIPTGGRSVRCSSCAESWYVPSPVPIDMLTPLLPNERAPKQFGRAGSGAIEDRNFRSPHAPNRTPYSTPSYYEQPQFDGATALAYLNDSEANDDNEEADWEQIEADVQALRRRDERREEEITAALLAQPAVTSTSSRTAQAATTSPFHRELQSLEAALMERGPRTSPTSNNAAGTALVPHDPAMAANQTALSDLGRDAGAALSSLGKVFTSSARLALAHIDKITWPVLPKAAEADPNLVMTPGDGAVDNFREQTRRRARRRMTPLKAIGWMIWMSAFAGVFVGFFMLRTQIMDFAPSTKSVYQSLGLYAPELYPVTLSNVTHRYALSSGGPVVELRGMIENTGTTLLAAPMIRAEAYDATGAIVAAWEFPPQAKQLSPSMQAPFLSRAPAPETITNVRLLLIPATMTDIPVDGAQPQQFYMERTTGGWSSSSEPPPVALSRETATKPATDQ